MKIGLVYIKVAMGILG